MRVRACMVVLNSCRSASSVTRPATRFPTYTCSQGALLKTRPSALVRTAAGSRKPAGFAESCTLNPEAPNPGADCRQLRGCSSSGVRPQPRHAPTSCLHTDDRSSFLLALALWIAHSRSPSSHQAAQACASASACLTLLETSTAGAGNHPGPAQVMRACLRLGLPQAAAAAAAGLQRRVGLSCWLAGLQTPAQERQRGQCPACAAKSPAWVTPQDAGFPCEALYCTVFAQPRDIVGSNACGKLRGERAPPVQTLLPLSCRSQSTRRVSQF